MNITKFNKIFFITLFLSSVCGSSRAQTTDIDLQRLPWDIFAESMVFDGKSSTYIYNSIQFSQGTISIKSDEGRAILDQNNSGIWNFSGNVNINVNNGRINCDFAELIFDGNALTKATITGMPATFLLQRDGAEDATQAEAEKLFYDVQNGTIEFSVNASIMEGNNEISSEYFIYNINERRINADSMGVNDNPVRIIYTPNNNFIEEELPIESEDKGK
ncbi:MAG: hypothetical protein CMO97_01415 [Woeseia sp.]|nr:hypothetical protein [Woeseia sp.]|tara:strand:+ start:14584 stop:15237 length:654 start_codon:yes stop_codon:yes gene_type:complete